MQYGIGITFTGKNYGVYMKKCIIAAAAAVLLVSEPELFSQNSYREQTSEASEEEIAASAGVMFAEDMGEEEAEHLYSLKSKPLKINLASRSRLVESGLFSPYQVAAILDYRNRNGDILSFSELAAVDGFGSYAVQVLAPFVSLDSYSLPGRSSSGRNYVSNSVVLKSAVRFQETASGWNEPEYSYGMKYRFSMNDRLEAALTCRSSYAAVKFPPEAASFYAAYYGRKLLGKVIAGDFNARFGQGLVMWSGFSMSGIPTQSAFSKRPSGISPYWSYAGDGSHRGIAADFCAGNFTVSAFASFPGLRGLTIPGKSVEISLLPGLNVMWSGMDGQVSFTCVASSIPFLVRKSDGQTGMTAMTGRFFENCHVSADARYAVKGVEIFGEAALDVSDRTVAALVGCKFSPCRGLYLASGLRFYPPGYESEYSGAVKSGSCCSNEYGLAFSGSFYSGKYVRLAGMSGFGSSSVRHQGSFSLDISHSPEPKYGTDKPSTQFKSVFSYSCQLSSMFCMQWKMSERIRSYGDRFRTDVRCDVKYSDGRLSSAVRLDVLHSTGLGLLSYIESGYKCGSVYAYVRGGVFRIDNWSDRIYAYERDAPGSFSVPAYYGRGFWLSAVAGIRVFKWGRCYFRAAYTGYPWASPGQEKKKPGRAELKIQISVNL